MTSRVGDWSHGLWRPHVEAPLGGGAATTLAAEPVVINAIAIDDRNVSYVTGGAKTAGRLGAVKQVSLDGAKIEKLDSRQSNPLGIAVHGKTAYWTDSGTGAVKKVTPD